MTCHGSDIHLADKWSEKVNPDDQETVDKNSQLKKKDHMTMEATTAAKVQYDQCQSLIKADKVEDAIGALERIVSTYPDYALAYNDLGVLYYRTNDKERCQKAYEKAVSIEPQNATFRKNLADFYLVEQGRMQNALELYLSVLKDDPEDIDVLLAAGHICVALGKTNSAKVFYERVLDIEPWNFDASERLQKLEID